MGKKEEPLLAAVRKKAMETENTKKKEEDDIKIKEMQEKIKKYKDELRKGSEFDEYMSKGKKRFSLNEKNAEAIESKFKDNLRKINEEEREKKKKEKEEKKKLKLEKENSW